MTDLFDVRLWLYPGANPQSDPALWEPYAVDISSKIRHPGNDGGAAITYSGGKQDEANQVDSGIMNLTLDNRDGLFSTDNLSGTYYGLLDLNTPIRMGVRSWVDNFARSVSNGWGTVNAAQLFSWDTSAATTWFNVTGGVGTVAIPTTNTAVTALASRATSKDVDVTCTITPNATATGGSYGAGTIVRRTDSTNFAYSTIEFDTAGTVTIKIRQVIAGVTSTLASINPIPASSYTAGVAWKLRTQADGNQIRAMVWAAAGTPPTTWHITATQSSLTGNSIGMYVARFAGNTNAGTTLSVDDFQVTALEFTGGVVSWPLRWDITGNNSWAPITATGVLNRLQQGTNPIQSPLRRQLSGTATVTGYWPLEDGVSAKSFGSTVPGQNPAMFSGVTPAQDDTLPGGGPAPTITTAGGSIGALTNIPNNGTGFAAMFLFKLPSLPVSKTLICRFRCNRGIVAYWDISFDATNQYVEGFASDGTSLTSAVNVTAPLDPTQWTAIDLQVDNTVGGPSTSTWTSYSHNVGQDVYYIQNGTFGSSLTSWIYSASLYGAVGTAFGHIWFGQNTLPFVTTAFSLVSAGYAGELAADRFARVCTEAGIPYIVRPGDSEKMGAQPKGSTINILRACERADYAAVAERGAGLEYYPRSTRWNLGARMTISKVSGEIGDAPEMVRDDQRLKNKFTMSRTDGGSATFQDDASIARNGTWEDSGIVNVFDDSVLSNHAAWRVNAGINKSQRLPQLTLNFARSPLLIPFWRARDYGFRIAITTGLVQLTGNDPDVLVEGFQCTLWPNGWTAVLNCSATKIWRSAVSDDTGVLGRVDSDACTLSAGIDASTLSIPVVTTTGQLKWDNTAALWSGGVDFNIGGERITVTSITNGAGQAQTLNATARGVGGYAFAHSSGASVSLWDPAVVGF
jgi:hypothetical protein